MWCNCDTMWDDRCVTVRIYIVSIIYLTIYYSVKCNHCSRRDIVPSSRCVQCGQRVVQPSGGDVRASAAVHLVMSADIMLTGGRGGGSCWLLISVVWSLHVLQDDTAVDAALPPVIRIGEFSEIFAIDRMTNGRRIRIFSSIGTSIDVWKKKYKNRCIK